MQNPPFLGSRWRMENGKVWNCKVVCVVAWCLLVRVTLAQNMALMCIVVLQSMQIASKSKTLQASFLKTFVILV